MSLGKREFRGRRRRQGGALVDLTPLIDVTFQLLIFFLLTATFRDFSSLNVDLAEAKNKQPSSEQSAVTLSIDAEGKMEIDGKIVDGRELEMRLCAEHEAGKVSLRIRADKNSRHQPLVDSMAAGKACGYTSLGILHTN